MLADRAQRLAAGLAELGVEPGDRVVVLMSNCPDVGVAYSGAWRAGAVLTPLIFLLSPEELGHVLADSGARAVITTPDLADGVRQARRRIETLEWVVTTGEAGEGELALSELEQAKPRPIVPRGDRDPAALMYTGGTTGRAKGVVLSHEMLWRAGAGRRRRELRARRQPEPGDAAALARLRAARDRRGAARAGAERRRASALVRPGVVPHARGRARAPDERGRAVDDPGSARLPPRAVRPLDAAPARLRGGAARARPRPLRQGSACRTSSCARATA